MVPSLRTATATWWSQDIIIYGEEHKLWGSSLGSILQHLVTPKYSSHYPVLQHLRMSESRLRKNAKLQLKMPVMYTSVFNSLVSNGKIKPLWTECQYEFLKLILKLVSLLPSFPNTSTLAQFRSSYRLSLTNAILSCNLMIGRVLRARFIRLAEIYCRYKHPTYISMIQIHYLCLSKQVFHFAGLHMGTPMW